MAHLLRQPRMVLGDPTGCGKTPQALIAWGILRKQKGWPVLVLARKSNLTPWCEKADLFLEGVTTGVYHGPDREQVLASNPDLLVTTYETAANDVDILLAHYGGCPPVVMLDEAHQLTGWSTPKRVKGVLKQPVIRPALARLTAESTYVMGLTATPESGKFSQVAALLDFIVPGLFGGERRFLDEFTKRIVIKPKNGRWFVKKPTTLKDYKNVNRLLKRVEPYILRRPVEVFDEVLPSVDFREYWVDPDPKHLALINQVKDGFLPATEDRDDKLIQSKGAAHAICQIVADAPVARGYRHFEPAKARELLRLLHEEFADEKVIIYSRYKDVVDWLADFLKANRVHLFGNITGDRSVTQRDTIRSAFQSSPSSGVLLLTDAGSESLDLQAARAVVFYTMPWGTHEFTQVVGRARRIGTRHRSIVVATLGHEASLDRGDHKRLKTKTELTKTLQSATTHVPVLQ